LYASLLDLAQTVTGLDNYTTLYDYDQNNRLLVETSTEKGNKKTEYYHYKYDNNGNLLERNRSVIRKKTGNEGPPRIWFVQDERPDGNVTFDYRRYNGFNQTVQINKDALQQHNIYRPDGLRHSKEVRNRFKKGTKVLTTHVWDSNDIILEINGKYLLKSKFFRAGGLIHQSIGDNRYYYLTNAHGDTIRRIDQNGDLTPEYIYDSFGNEYGLEGTTHVMRLADANPFRYCGEYYDIDTKEYYLRNRRYDPRIGRFTSEDPISSGSNAYEYCGNNPVTRCDPSGLDWTEIREVDGQEILYYYSTNIGYTNTVVLATPSFYSNTRIATGVSGASLDANDPVVKPISNYLSITTNNNSGVYVQPSGDVWLLGIPFYIQMTDWKDIYNFGSTACNAASVLAIAQYYFPNMNITMEQLVTGGQVRKSDAFVNFTTPYFTVTSCCVGASVTEYGPVIKEQLLQGKPVKISLGNHYVVAIAVIGEGIREEDIIVMDPANKSRMYSNMSEVLAKETYYGLLLTKKGYAP
jgi:RHS repeat-associated protein